MGGLFAKVDLLRYVCHTTRFYPATQAQSDADRLQARFSKMPTPSSLTRLRRRVLLSA